MFPSMAASSSGHWNQDGSRRWQRAAVPRPKPQQPGQDGAGRIDGKGEDGSARPARGGQAKEKQDCDGAQIEGEKRHAAPFMGGVSEPSGRAGVIS